MNSNRTLFGRLTLLLVAAALSAGCAARIEAPKENMGPRLHVQSAALAPGNGGEMTASSDLQPGDILLSATDGLTSAGIRLLTLAPVSHAAIYVGDGQIVEAVGSGVRMRPLQSALDEESMVAAFRHPLIEPDRAEQVVRFAQAQIGTQYNHVGLMLYAPFAVQRRLCDLPVVLGKVREACIRGVATVQMGIGSNDRFFCSQLVLEAYLQAGLPLAATDSRSVSPADLLHMREGDVPSLVAAQPLVYIGHLKYTAPMLTASNLD